MSIKREKVICPSCGKAVTKLKYCVECGYSLKDALEVTEVNDNINTSTKSQALSDEGLTMLVNTCKKTIATVGGDGYSEIVLYIDEKSGEYFIHTYSKYVYMKEEEHASYVTTKELADKVFKYINDNDLVSWKDNHFLPGMCGGDYIIRFRHNNEIIYLNSAKMMDNLKAYTTISNLLSSQLTQENRRYKTN